MPSLQGAEKIQCPSHIAALADAMLEVIRRGGKIASSYLAPKNFEMVVQDANGTQHIIAANPWNFKLAQQKVAKKLGGDDAKPSSFTKATKATFRMPVFQKIVEEIVSNGGTVQGHTFVGMDGHDTTVTLQYITAAGEQHKVAFRPEERQRALEDVVMALAA